MAMNKLDEMNLMGVIKRNKIACYDDLYIDTRSKLTIDDFLNATANIALKFISSTFSEKQIENALNAVVIVLLEVNGYRLTIDKKELYNKLISFKSYKGKYNDMIDGLIDAIVNLTTQTCIVFDENTKNEEDTNVNEEKTEEIIDYEKEYQLSLERIKELEEKTEQFENQIKGLQKAIDKKNKSSDNALKKSSEQIEEIRNLKKEVERLKKLLAKETDNSKSYESELAKSSKELESAKRENRVLGGQVNDLKNKVKTFQKSHELYEEYLSSKETYEKNVLRVLGQIVDKRSSISDIERALLKDGIKLSYGEISDIIEHIKLKYHIDDSILSNFERTYRLTAPEKRCGGNFDFETTRKRLDFLVMSDSHIGIFDFFDIETVDKIYEYMSKNGIKYILDLGDFFSFNYLSLSKKTERMRFNDRIIETVIKRYPRANDIVHLILGGNHDKELFSYGIDPIKKLDEARKDFVSIGYDFATITLNHDSIGLYHPNYRYEEMYSDSLIYQTIAKRSHDVCSNLKVDYDSLYVNLYGHFHIFMKPNFGIVSIPSISFDRERNGAVHMSVYFDDDGNIENVTFTKLVFASRLIDKEKYEYQKVRSYKK